MVHFLLTTFSGNTKLRFDVDTSTSIAAFIRLVEMTIKAEIRGKGQAEEKMNFHVCELFCSYGNKKEKKVTKMRHSTETVGEYFEDQVSAVIMMGTLKDGDTENEDGKSLRDWHMPGNGDGAQPEHSDGMQTKKRGTKDTHADGGSKKARTEASGEGGGEVDGSVGGGAVRRPGVKTTFFSLADNVRLDVTLEYEDGSESVDVAKILERVEAMYVEDRKANALGDPFGLFSTTRPVEITSLIMFGLRDRPSGSFVKTVQHPFPELLVPSTSPAPPNAQASVVLDLAEGDFIAFDFKRNARTEQTLSAFPEGFVRMMGGLAKAATGDNVGGAASAGGFGGFGGGGVGGVGEAEFCATEKELILSKLKGHPQLLEVYKSMFNVTVGGSVVVLDPSKASVDDGLVFSNVCEGSWRVGRMGTKMGSRNIMIDSLIVCHSEYENVQGLSALIKNKGTSGWKKAGEVSTESTFAGVFDVKEFKAGAGEKDAPGQYLKPCWQQLAILPEGTYCKAAKGAKAYPVYSKERGGKVQAIKIMFMSGSDYK